MPRQLTYFPTAQRRFALVAVIALVTVAAPLLLAATAEAAKATCKTEDALGATCAVRSWCAGALLLEDSGFDDLEVVEGCRCELMYSNARSRHWNLLFDAASPGKALVCDGWA